MCITQAKRYNRPIKKAYKVLQYHCDKKWKGPFVSCVYEIGSVKTTDNVESCGIHFFQSKEAAKHYYNRLKKDFQEDSYGLFEVEIPSYATVWKGKSKSDDSISFNTKRYPIMYTTTAIKIIGECK